MNELLFQLKIEAESESAYRIDESKLSGRVVSDSRQVRPGDIFVAVAGPVCNGHDFISQAVSAGAAIVVHEQAVDTSKYNTCHFIQVFSSASSLGRLAQVSFGKPASELQVFGVTGTNGKTTVASMVKWIMDHSGNHCGFIGTIGYDCGDGMVPLDNTTPGSIQLAEIMSQMVKKGMAAVAMECSSHGLEQRRTEGIYHTAAAFTNLSGDHLDYHKTMDNYRDSKAIIFEHLRPDGVAVINHDDPNFDYFYDVANSSGRRVITFGVDRADSELTAQIRSANINGSDVTVTWDNKQYDFRLPIPARHNVSNFLAAAGLALAGGLTMTEVITAISGFPGVPGRLNRVERGQKFAVLIDYAHTDDALERVLATIRPLTEKRVILVFGCGGDRDNSKRPRMAAVASKYSDLVVITNDNPRTESPDKIIGDIVAGLTAADDSVWVIPDRKAAIRSAIVAATEGDCVIIAGKGHENYQIIGSERFHFDDFEQAELAIDELVS